MGGISVLVLIGFLTSIYILWILFLVCLTIYLLNDYIFESIFIYKVSKSKLAFIPIYNKIILGKTFRENKLGFSIFLTDLLLFIVANTLGDFTRDLTEVTDAKAAG